MSTRTKRAFHCSSSATTVAAVSSPTNLPPHHLSPRQTPHIKPAGVPHTPLVPVPPAQLPLLRSCSFTPLCSLRDLGGSEMAAAAAAAESGGRKRKAEELGEIHEDMLERVLARLPPASYFRLRGVCRRWREAAGSPTFLAACGGLTARDPWFLMLSDRQPPAVAFNAAEGTWALCRGGAPGGPVPVAASGGLVLYRAPDTGALTVANPLTGASRALPTPPAAPGALHAVAMYGSPYRVVLILGELPDLSMAVFDSSKNAWEDAVALSRKPEASSADELAPGGGGEDEDVDDDDDTVYFLSKSGDVMASSMQRSASRQYSSVVACRRDGEDQAVAYFLSHSGAVVACDLSRRVFAELPRILPLYCEYSIDVVACDDRAYVVVLSEYLDTASLRVWEYADGAWRQAAAMPPAMSHPLYGKKADVNCVGHGGRVMVCVSSGEASGGCFMCDVGSNRWEELPPCSSDASGEAMDFVAAFSFEPRMEAAV